jgi:hypothetical protein
MPSKIRDIADILGVTEAANPTNAALTSTADGSGLVVYATLDDLPTSGLTSGDQAYVTATNRLYVSNGSGWYNVALFNATPTLSISPSGAVSLAVDGSTPTVITLTGTDSDNADANLTYTVESDGSFSNIATISQDSSVFTITPLAEDSATPGSSTLTFKVSDGISFGSGTKTFSLTFGPDWSATPTESIIRASDGQAGDQFGGLADNGVSISDDGDYAIVSAPKAQTAAGSPNTAGAAYIFSRSGSTWTQQAKLVSSDIEYDDDFSYSVCLSGDGTRAVVGARYEDSPGNNDGAVYIFSRSGSTWTQETKISSPVYQGSLFFGNSVSINYDGSYIAASGPRDNTNVSRAGAVWIYTRSGTTWTLQQKLTASDAQASDYFGQSVSISSDGLYLITGAHAEDGGSGDPLASAGAAYVFSRSGSTWTQQQKLVEPTPVASASFGVSVDINSDGTYVTAYSAGTSLAGAVHVFTRSGSTWTHQAELTASDAQANDFFGRYGSRISENGLFIVCGAQGEDGGSGDPTANAGAAYVFERDGSTWTEVKRLTASNAAAGDDFGRGVDISSNGAYIIVGARYEDGADNLSNSQGAAYIYEA